MEHGLRAREIERDNSEFMDHGLRERERDNSEFMDHGLRERERERER